MNNKNNKVNLTLTVFGLLGSCAVANAQQLRQEPKPEPVKQNNPAAVAVPPKAPAANVAPAPVAHPVAAPVAAAPAKVEVKAPVAAPVAPTPAKVEAKAPAAPVKAEEAKKAEVKAEPKKEEVKVEAKPEAKVEAPKAEAKKEETKVEVKKEEPKKPEFKEKLQLTKAFNERTKLVEKYSNGKGLLIGVFPGSVAVVDTTSYIGRYLPFANHLTYAAGDLVSFVPELNTKVLKDRIAKGKYDLLYINAEAAVVAMKNGYEPLAQYSEKIVSVVMTKSGSTVSKIQDLPSVKVGAVGQAMVTTLARAKFKRENANVNLISAGLTGQKDLNVGLDNGNFDAVILRQEAAASLIAKNPEKYKIAMVLDEAPGFILMAKKEMSSSVKENLAKSLISLNKENPNDKAILAGMDAQGGGYVKIDPKEIEAFDNKTKIVEQQ